MKKGGGVPILFGFRKLLQVFDISRGKKHFFSKKCSNNGHSYKYEKKHKDSFLTLHQEKAHNNEDENFKLSVTRFYGQDRLSCEIAEAVILRTRTGDVCNLKSEWHDPPLVQVTRRVQRGL